MRTRRMLVPWVPFVLVAALVGWSWRGATPSHQEAPADEVAADLAGLDPDTLVVDFRDDLPDAALAANRWVEEPVSSYSAVDRLYRVHFASRDEAARALAELRRDPTVEAADFDAVATAFPVEAARTIPSLGECGVEVGAETKGFPNDTCFRYQWHLAQVGLPSAWKLGRGQGVTVAVIDTGVTRVPDLAGVEMVPGYNFVANSTNADDDHGHGTHVAGTVAQATNNRLGVGGVAFGARIMPLKVLSASGSGSMAAIAQAIRWAADHGAQVINMSLGGPFPVAPIKNAIEYARNKGVVVVAAAGNDGRGRVSYPAKYPGVIAVAATQFDETTTFYSNWGKEIDIAAPGGNVRVDQNGDGKPDGVLQNTVVPGDIGRTDYLWFMGTSMASPHVAGVAALVVGAGVTRPEKVEAVLLESARKPRPLAARADAKRYDDRYGAGLVDAGAALKKARVGRGAATVGLGASLALAGLLGLRRRGRLASGVGLGFAASMLAGAVGLHEGLGALAGAGAWGNPLLASALLPVGAVALLWGVRRARPGLAGFAFGMAGALLFGALAQTTDVRWVPDAVERLWLLANAAVAALIGTASLRR